MDLQHELPVPASQRRVALVRVRAQYLERRGVEGHHELAPGRVPPEPQGPVVRPFHELPHNGQQGAAGVEEVVDPDGGQPQAASEPLLRGADKGTDLLREAGILAGNLEVLVFEAIRPLRRACPERAMEGHGGVGDARWQVASSRWTFSARRTGQARHLAARRTNGNGARQRQWQVAGEERQARPPGPCRWQAGAPGAGTRGDCGTDGPAAVGYTPGCRVRSRGLHHRAVPSWRSSRRERRPAGQTT